MKWVLRDKLLLQLYIENFKIMAVLNLLRLFSAWLVHAPEVLSVEVDAAKPAAQGAKRQLRLPGDIPILFIDRI